MNYECKITVLETKVFPELQEKYLADPKYIQADSFPFIGKSQRTKKRNFGGYYGF